MQSTQLYVIVCKNKIKIDDNVDPLAGRQWCYEGLILLAIVYGEYQHTK